MNLKGSIKKVNITGNIRVQTMSGEIKYLGDVGPQGPIGPPGNDYDDTELREMIENVDKKIVNFEEQDPTMHAISNLEIEEYFNWEE